MIQHLPHSVSVFAENSVSHLQGIAIDRDRKFMYFSFTTCLLKTDLQGKSIGSVSGLPGHLGCIAHNPQDNRVYGSLEFKHDTIGTDILGNMRYDRAIADGFYAVCFDTDKIHRMDMPPDQVMQAVYLKEVYDDYSAAGHRYGCSGIDGITFAPAFGEDSGKHFLYVAYGIYGDTARDDNDHQVLVKYDISSWDTWARPLDLQNMHTCGPDKPEGKYFVYTGNTTYGIQNLEYDPFSRCMIAAVYRGRKDRFPNHPMFFIDCTAKPKKELLRGIGEEADVLALTDFGHGAGSAEIPGSEFPLGSTGIISLGSGYFYIADGFRNERGFGGRTDLYRFLPHRLTFEIIGSESR